MFRTIAGTGGLVVDALFAKAGRQRGLVRRQVFILLGKVCTTACAVQF